LTLHVPIGECVALAGESGCGKTMLTRCVLGLQPATSGSVTIAGIDIAGLRGAALRSHRRRVQIVFQNPYAALNPRITVERLIDEPSRFVVADRAERRAAIVALLDDVGLGSAYLGRYPHELSGGQCQRVAIARALAVNPRLLVLDEPTSALDVSVQALVLDLLGRLRAARGLTYLLISHDLALVRQLASYVHVMRHGQIVEAGAIADVFGTPSHPYTRLLLDSVPGRGRAVLMQGEPPQRELQPEGVKQ
jgi:ABC-type glutathione transport system ATPase component